MNRLILVTDRRRVRGGDLVAAVEGAVAGGVGTVILREKDLPAGELLALGERLRAVTRGRALLVVSDRLDVALACDADGVQFGEAGLPVEAARRVMAGRLGLRIGRSVHSVEGARAAEAAGADSLLVGSIFETASHPGQPGAGIQFLRAVSRAVAVPVFAIGGVTPGNVAECLNAGAWGVAVISAILGAPDPQAAAQAFVRGLGDAP